jgi:hypothetical protein
LTPAWFQLGRILSALLQRTFVPRTRTQPSIGIEVKPISNALVVFGEFWVKSETKWIHNKRGAAAFLGLNRRLSNSLPSRIALRFLSLFLRPTSLCCPSSLSTSLFRRHLGKPTCGTRTESFRPSKLTENTSDFFLGQSTFAVRAQNGPDREIRIGVLRDCFWAGVRVHTDALAVGNTCYLSFRASGTTQAHIARHGSMPMSTRLEEQCRTLKRTNYLCHPSGNLLGQIWPVSC